jgi:hypothetical protein
MRHASVRLGFLRELEIEGMDPFYITILHPKFQQKQKAWSVLRMMSFGQEGLCVRL